MDLSPTGWPRGELEKYSQLNLVTGVPKPPVEANKGMVVGACGPLAIRAGVEALKKGGNAVDAALTTSLTQVCLLAGSNVSFAGVSMIGAFNLLELADLEKYSHYTRSARALYQFIRISRVCGLYYNLAMGRKGLGKIFSKYISKNDFSRQSLMSKQTAVETPYFMTPAMHPGENNKQTVGEGQFPDEILNALQAMGQEIKVLPSEKQWLQTGAWVGIKIDPKTGKRKGGVPLMLNGVAAGY